MFPVMKASLVAVTTFGGAILSLAIVSRPAIAGSLFITIEAPGVQQSQLTTNPSAYGATNVAVENFDSQPVGFNSSGFLSSIGTYSLAEIAAANLYGGAGGIGKYLDVSKPFNYTTSTLTLKNPQRYFGFWLSALDYSNELDFYSGGTIVEKFTAQDILNFINK